ncbi:hypothetical protein Tco_1379092 [Tanacetum coccineum]
MSKSDEYQVYGALLLEVITNQKMRNSPAYKTYLAFATGAATPKKARKFKKPASPSKKRTLIIVEEEEPEPAKKVALTKKSSRKQSTVKKVLKRIQRETTIHQAGGSGDGAGFQLEVLDEPKGKPVDTHKGTGYSGDESNYKINDDEEESDNEFVHTPEDYVPTNDEANDETKDEESGPEMASIQGQYVEQATTTTTPAIQNANTEVPPLSSSHSVSSTYTNAFLNLENLHSTKTEVVSNKIPESETLYALHQRTTNLEKDVKELKNIDKTITVISTIKSEVSNAVKEYLGSWIKSR